MTTYGSDEYEQGTFTRTPHRHNGYYAGDFSKRPFPGRVTELMALRTVRNAPVGVPW